MSNQPYLFKHISPLVRCFPLPYINFHPNPSIPDQISHSYSTPLLITLWETPRCILLSLSSSPPPCTHQAFLLLRHLHRWLVEGTWTPTSPAAASASIRVDSEFLALVGVDLAPHPAPTISRANDENETSLTSSSSSSPTVGDRIQLSSRRCMACRLPYNWPASVVIPPVVKERSSDASSAEGLAHPTPDSLEIYVVLDDLNFFVASPDPNSPLDHGLLLCATPLRNAVAKTHPANPRVLELRVSTQEAGQEGAGGPGLFLSTTNASPRNSAEAGSRWEGGVNFRGVGHRGLWHLVSLFNIPPGLILFAIFFKHLRGGV